MLVIKTNLYFNAHIISKSFSLHRSMLASASLTPSKVMWMITALSRISSAIVVVVWEGGGDFLTFFSFFFSFFSLEDTRSPGWEVCTCNQLYFIFCTVHLDIWSAAFHLQRNKIKGFSRVVRAFYVQFQILSCYLRGGFSLAGEEFGGRFDNSFSTCTFFLKWGSACTHQFHRLGQD